MKGQSERANNSFRKIANIIIFDLETSLAQISRAIYI